MGSPPPPDAPPPDDPGIVSANIGFPPSPTAADICGFKIPPMFTFNLSLNIPFPNFKLPLPFNFSLALKCDLSNPIDAEVTFGGGKSSVGNFAAQDTDY